VAPISTRATALTIKILTPTLIALRGLWSTHLGNIHEDALREGNAEPREVIEVKLYRRTRNEFVKQTDGI